jgi:hypothetical protein
LFAFGVSALTARKRSRCEIFPPTAGGNINVTDVMKGSGIGVAASTRCPVRSEFLVMKHNNDGEIKKAFQGWVLPTLGSPERPSD